MTYPRLLAFASIVLLQALGLNAQDDSRPRSISGPVTVQIDATKTQNFLAPRAIGIEASVLDPDLASVAVANLLHDAGTLTLSYPGGPASDQYHWSTNTMIYRDGKPTVLDKGTNFGNFVRLIDHIGGTAMISVNYGSNPQGNGPGVPQEAAAWVAYCNGKPDDAHVIGKDAAGFDWHTTGYWAGIRGAAPLATDDGYNFLRLHHSAPINIKYWTIGNDVYGNGYYGKDGQGYSDDRHALLSIDDATNLKTRSHNPALAPAAYGEGVVQFSKAMKAVDARISIGAGLNTPGDNAWGQDWNSVVLKACAAEIDFVVLHWYAGRSLPPDWKKLDTFDALYATDAPLTAITSGLIESFHKYSGGRALQLAVTELNVHPWLKIVDPQPLGLYAADTYASLAEDGAVNVDWHELHEDLFLRASDNQPGPVYYGIRMVHEMVNPRDLFVASKSSSALLSVHAVKRGDGGVGLMLINKDPENAASVKIHISGEELAATGSRLEWGKLSKTIDQKKVDGLGNNFTVTLPPYSVTDLIMTKATK
jgi:hypothetical protein